jgi:hypothetical protein
MQPRIAISRGWSDEDVAQLSFSVCDGHSVFVNQAYASLDWGSTAAAALRTFSRQIHGGLFNLEAGDGGPEYASGAFRARFHWWRPTVLVISTSQQGDYFPFKGSEVASEAKMFLRTQPALLDRFIAELPSLDAGDDHDAILECIELDTHQLIGQESMGHDA